MRLENAVAADVLERILSAYGFTMQKELSDKLGIAKSNVASWLQRGQVPGNVLVQCALDTGADVQWLVTGVFANANTGQGLTIKKTTYDHGEKLIKAMLSTGGRVVLQRIMHAYGFRTQKELSEHLGISTGTISTWVRREYFPGDVVIACAIETGTSLNWLATGNNDDVNPISNLERRIDLINIETQERSELNSNVSECLFKYFEIDNILIVEKNDVSWVVDSANKTLSNGKWLINIDGAYDIYQVTRLPNQRVRISAGSHDFICKIDDVTCEGQVKKIIKTL